MGFFSNLFGKKEERAYDVNADLYGKDYNGVSFLGSVGGVGSIPVNESTTLKLSAVWACVRIKSNQLATLPFNFYQKDKKGDSYVSANLAAQRVMKRPNKYMSAFDFKFAMMSAKMLHGNGYARIVRDSNLNPIELYPLHPDRVEPKIENGVLVYLIDRTQTLQAEDILHFKGLSLDGLVGLSAIKSQAQNLGLALSSQNELKQFYEKGSKIDGFVSYPNKLGVEAKPKMEEAFTNKISGSSPTTKTPILDNGAKYVPVGVNPAEALWLEMMGYGVEEICRIFGVPPHLIASLKQSTNNNIEHQGMDFVNHGLLPEAKCFEEELDRKLLSSFEEVDHYCKFNMNGLLRGDSAARAALYQSLHNTGSISANEIRRLEEMNGYTGGDTYFIQLNQIDITKSTEYYMTPKPTATREIDEIDELIKRSKEINK
jgi:HK97 family phage portal protein